LIDRLVLRGAVTAHHSHNSVRVHSSGIGKQRGHIIVKLIAVELMSRRVAFHYGNYRIGHGINRHIHNPTKEEYQTWPPSPVFKNRLNFSQPLTRWQIQTGLRIS
jgi:hypothetical protein